MMTRIRTLALVTGSFAITTAPASLDYGPWMDAARANDAGPSPGCVHLPEDCPRKWTWTSDDGTISKWCAPGSTGWAWFRIPGETWWLLCCPTQAEFRYVYSAPGGSVIGTQTRCGDEIFGWPH